MAAIEGFELSISTGDVVVGDGMVNGVAIEGATLDAAGLATGNVLIVATSANALAMKDVAARLASDVCLGSATNDASDAITAVSLAGRGTDAPVVK